MDKSRLLSLGFALGLLGVSLGGALVGAGFENLLPSTAKGEGVDRVGSQRREENRGCTGAGRASQPRGLEAVRAWEGQTHPRCFLKEKRRVQARALLSSPGGEVALPGLGGTCQAGLMGGMGEGVGCV